MSPLEKVSRARGRRGEAEGAYLAAVRAAHRAGENITAIARAAGVSRPTVYKILKNESE